jgi:methionyl-tRNA formyltransferase
MRITLVGSRHFGVTTFNMLREHGVEIARIVVHDAEDRLAAAAKAAGVDVAVQADPKFVTAAEIAPNTDLIVTAHSHARITREALASAKLGGIGYHPSLLPRHRGIAAIEWTIKEGDPIAGGTIYHLADRMDAGAIAAQEWVLVKPPANSGSGRWPRSAKNCSARSSTTPRSTRPCPPNPRTNSLPPWRRAFRTPSTDQNGGDSAVSTGWKFVLESRSDRNIFLFRGRNRIHLDVFDPMGTFCVFAAQQSLNTL